MAAPQVQQPVPVPKSGTLLTVGCKLPNGIHLDFVERGKAMRRVSLRGANSSRVIGGFGITEGVPAEFFEEWMATHQDLPAVSNGLIFAMEKSASVADKAEEYKSLLNGLEPMPQEDKAAGIKKLSDKD
jgi:glutamate synthase domain-containing protein 1